MPALPAGVEAKRDFHNSFIRDVTFDLAAITTVTASDQAVTVPDVDVGKDIVLAVVPPAVLDYGLIVQNAWVSADNTVTVRVLNITGGTINAASGTWRFVIGRR